jgi:hypothetical protein
MGGNILTDNGGDGFLDYSSSPDPLNYSMPEAMSPSPPSLPIPSRSREGLNNPPDPRDFAA